MERIGSNGTRALSLAIALLGVAMVIRTIAAGGGGTSLGVLLGVVFVALGLARLYLSTRAAR
jgi:hypothetical protein